MCKGVQPCTGLNDIKQELFVRGLLTRLMNALTQIAGDHVQSPCNSTTKRLRQIDEFEVKLAEKVDKLAAAGKRYSKNIAPGVFRTRAFNMALSCATKYDVRAGGYEGSLDMVWMAWQRSRQHLNIDENELQYLLDELLKLKDKDTTASNWRDTADGYIAACMDVRCSPRSQAEACSMGI